jgi:hypothetical protein
MRPRRTLPLICLLITAFLLATSPLSARDLRVSSPAPAAGWLAEMTGWLVSLWDGLTGRPEAAVPDSKSLAAPVPLPPTPPAGENISGPGGSCIDPNGEPSINCT